MRVYLPATLSSVRDWHLAGETAPGLTAFAVTPALRASYGDGSPAQDEEELEWAAQTLAARGSLRLFGERGPAPRREQPTSPDHEVRRVVIAADVAEREATVLDGTLEGTGEPGSIEPGSVEPGSVEPGSVRLGATVPVAGWAAVLVDEVPTDPVIRAAAGLIGRADAGDPDAARVIGEADDVDLLWFAVTEVGRLGG